ncbi:hypothetical protein [Cupriavidus basilensis]|nr:hypothetical protein [Cupriavidus basilensis]
MRATFQIDNPGDVEMVLTVKMKLSDWVALQKQLPSEYPSWKLTAAISEMTMHAKQVFTPSKAVDT